MVISSATHSGTAELMQRISVELQRIGEEEGPEVEASARSTTLEKSSPGPVASEET